MTKQELRIRKAIEFLDGMTFADRDILESAILPHFGQLIDIFTGQGHRDFVDRLVMIGWITLNSSNGNYKLKIPPINPLEESKKVIAVSEENKFAKNETSSITFSFQEIHTLVHLYTTRDFVLETPKCTKNKMLNLVKAGYVTRQDISLTDVEVYAYKLTDEGMKYMNEQGDALSLI